MKIQDDILSTTKYSKAMDDFTFWIGTGYEYG